VAQIFNLPLVGAKQPAKHNQASPNSCQQSKALTRLNTQIEN